MRTMSFLLMALWAVAGVHAAQDEVVLKDTREWDVYTVSAGGLVGCRMPQRPNASQPGECEHTTDAYVKSGELLTRKESRGTCTLTIWRQVERKPLQFKGRDISAPSMERVQELFPCDPQGQRLAS